MSFSRDLLEQARHLASREPRRPRQASLRRAVSSAYYALFHLFTEEATKLTRPPEIRSLVRRVFEHGSMKAVCKAWSGKGQFAKQTLALVQHPIEPELSMIAETFIELQEARHRADYDFSLRLTKVEVRQHINDVQAAFHDWEAVRDTSNAAIFLSALLYEKHWKARSA